MLTLTKFTRRIAELHRMVPAGSIFPATVLTMLALLSYSYAQAEEVYRWVDAEGVVNYTQQKPRDIEAQALTTQRGAPTRVRATSNNSSTESTQLNADGSERPMTDAQQRMLDELQAKEAARQQEVAEIREENCSKSRRILSDLSAKERIRVRDDDGQERIMPEDERQRRISEAQKGIVDNCAASA